MALGKPTQNELNKYFILLQLIRNQVAKRGKIMLKKFYKQLIKHYIHMYLKYKYINTTKFTQRYKQELLFIIRHIYNDCFDNFGFLIRNRIKKNQKSFYNLETKYNNIDYSFNELQDELITKYGIQHTDYILDTITNDLEFYTQKAIDDVNEEIIQYNSMIQNEKLNTEVYKIKDKIQAINSNREQYIADKIEEYLNSNVLEQRAISQSENEMLYGETLAISAESQVIKNYSNLTQMSMYNCIFKEKSRETHKEAHGQTIAVGKEKFVINNPKTKEPEYCNHPRDDTLSLNNKINCYCFEYIYYI